MYNSNQPLLLPKTISLRHEGGGEVFPEKLGGGVRPASQKPLPYLRPKSSIFLTLFMTWPKIQYPVEYLTLKSMYV